MQFEGDWKAAIGCPELTGSWLVSGDSGSGKTTFTMMLAKYLTQFERVLYDSLEEGDSESIKMALIRVGMTDVNSRFLLLDNEPIDVLNYRLSRHKAPRIVIIDSVQYTGINYKEYKELKEKHRDKLFIFISHADGNHPKGNVAKSIHYDASVKIRVEGYKAFVKSRYMNGESEPYVIWKEGAEKYFGINTDQS